MKITLTKKFYFSASHDSPSGVTGHNYVLNVTTQALKKTEEVALEKNIHEALIQKIDSRDLGLHVDFLKNIEITDKNLLQVFWEIIQLQIYPVELVALSLERDERTQVLMAKDS